MHDRQNLFDPATVFLENPGPAIVAGKQSRVGRTVQTVQYRKSHPWICFQAKRGDGILYLVYSEHIILPRMQDQYCVPLNRDCGFINGRIDSCDAGLRWLSTCLLPLVECSRDILPDVLIHSVLIYNGAELYSLSVFIKIIQNQCCIWILALLEARLNAQYTPHNSENTWCLSAT